MTQHGFVLDLDRCTGCAACILACANENSPSAAIAWRNITTFNQQRLPTAPVFHYSLACNHCKEPACLVGCPADAYTKDPATGAVLIDRDRCMGCRYCLWVCPYEAPQFDGRSGIIEKCTFCNHRLAVDLEPACVIACPVDALGLERMDEPAVVRRAGFPETGLRPAARFVGERRLAPPEMTAVRTTATAQPARRRRGWRTFTAEWSLWAFTSIITLLTAWFTAAAVAGRLVILPVFAIAGLAAIGVSALHLGRPGRAWRGVFNWRGSWISREALAVTLFLGLGSVLTALPAPPPAAIWVAAAVGCASLIAMDMVYRVPGQSVQAVPHSAMTTLTAAYYVGLILAAPALALPAGLLKVVLYLARRRSHPGRSAVLAVFRVGVGLVFPGILLFVDGPSPWVLIAAAVAGELVDRAQFYAELEFLTPAIQVRRDLAIPG